MEKKRTIIHVRCRTSCVSADKLLLKASFVVSIRDKLDRQGHHYNRSVAAAGTRHHRLIISTAVIISVAKRYFFEAIGTKVTYI